MTPVISNLENGHARLILSTVLPLRRQVLKVKVTSVTWLVRDGAGTPSDLGLSDVKVLASYLVCCPQSSDKQLSTQPPYNLCHLTQQPSFPPPSACRTSSFSSRAICCAGSRHSTPRPLWVRIESLSSFSPVREWAPSLHLSAHSLLPAPPSSLLPSA